MTERERVRREHNELWQSATPALAPGGALFEAVERLFGRRITSLPLTL